MLDQSSSGEGELDYASAPAAAPRGLANPFLDASDDIALLAWAIQELQVRFPSVSTNIVDRKGASRHAKRALAAAADAKADLAKFTRRKASSKALQDLRRRHLVALRRALTSARRVGARLPSGLRISDLLVVGVAASIGFTVSLFFATAAGVI